MSNLKDETSNFEEAQHVRILLRSRENSKNSISIKREFKIKNSIANERAREFSREYESNAVNQLKTRELAINDF